MSGVVKGPHVFDARALINLECVDDACDRLRALEVRIIAERHAVREVTRSYRPGRKPLEVLECAGLLEVVDLDETGYDHFQQLVGATSPDDLDDGEAGAIACAQRLGLGIVLDDGKARRIVGREFPAMRTLFSIELFAAASSSPGFDEAKVRNAAAQAVDRARMRIPPQWRHLIDPGGTRK